MKKLYIATTFDKYELPIAVSDSVQGLADMIGIKPHAALVRISHGIHGDCRSNLHRIEYTEQEWEEA